MEFEFVRPTLDTALKEEAITFWLRENALPEEVARGRSENLLGTIRDGKALVGVSTGAITFDWLEGQPLVNYLTYVAAARRRQGLARQLLNVCFDGLEAIITEQAKPEAIGVVLRVPQALASKMDRHLNWPSVDFSYIGRASGGDHLRIRYFDEVKLR